MGKMLKAKKIEPSIVIILNEMLLFAWKQDL